MRRVKVWDAAVRLGHLALGALVLGAFLTSEDDATVPVHTRLGLALLGVVLFRVAWGFFGPEHARFRDFVKSPATVLRSVKAMVRGKPEHHLGHNPLGGLMVVALLGTLATIALTGLVVAAGPEWNGALAPYLSEGAAHAVKEVHEGAATFLLVLVTLHVAGVVTSSILEKQNLVAGMVTGYKQAPTPQALPASQPSGRPARPVAGLLAALAVAASGALLGWTLLGSSSAEAAAPGASLLGQYEAQARSEDAAFAGFDAQRGRALYFEEHPGKSGATSCATCHTEDARRVGRSPAGKVIQPLAPAANPERFTNLGKADKWFDRNCKQIFGRPCTARERGDLLSYLSSL